MKAKDISGQMPGGKRTKLAEALPLDTPFLLYVFPIYACNFKCEYCIFSVDEAQRGFISDKTALDFDLYKKCIDEVVMFPNQLKVLRFVGMGEPLLHNKISEMVEYAVSKNVTNIVEILTNASLLTPAMSDSLISAGLTRLIVSLQGTSSEKYLKVCGARIDFDTFLENLRYFYNNKGNAHLYIKIVDTALDGKEDVQRFYQLFGNICDTMAIEHTVPIYPGVDYENMLKDREMTSTQFGLPVSEVQVCPQPFFTMQINPDGKIVPCFSLAYPEIIGDCNKQSIHKIWNDEQFQKFRRRMLDGAETVCEICANCNIIKYRMSPEDILNDDAERLKMYY